MNHVKKITAQDNDLYFLNAYDTNGVICWYYLKVNKLKLPIFKFKCESQSSNLNIEEYGKVVASGWGNEPPARIKAEIEGKEYVDDEPSGDFVISLLSAYDYAGIPIYYYVAVALDKIDEFEKKMNAPVDFDVHANSIILLSGYGAPSDEEREMMEREYGFNHARLMDKDAPIPAYVSD